MRWERLVLLAAMLLGLAAAGCTTGSTPRSSGETLSGSGVMTSDTRSLAAFSAVELRALGNVVVERGATASIRIDGEDNLVPRITTGVQHGRLIIDWTSGIGSVNATRPITYHLTAPVDLTGLNVQGAGTIQLGAMQGDTLRLGVDGLGKISVDEVAVATLIANISGAGQIAMSGQAGRQQLTIDGVGIYQAPDLASRQADVTISGAGHAVVQVSDVLNAKINGIGSVRYAGQPRVNRSGDGLGQVTPMSSQ
ncbi:MAG TPA: head GIN domain-containing protein [Thermomicrobiaceae bacterium]|nr:head GIN domain-containing protein [Thermomicrobiaceae bacterium]